MEADTLMGIAKVFHAAGANWTVGLENFDAINYGLFYSDEKLKEILNRLLAAAHHLKCKTMVIGECGHATKAGLLFHKVFGNSEYRDIKIKSVLQVSHEFFAAGKLQLDLLIDKAVIPFGGLGRKRRCCLIGDLLLDAVANREARPIHGHAVVHCAQESAKFLLSYGYGTKL